jgi:hypothetical protein
MLVIVDQVQLARGAETASAAKETFRVRATDWPPPLPAPPAEWAGAWKGFVADYPVPWRELADAYAALRQFWEPVLGELASEADAVWDRVGWRWSTPDPAVGRSSAS